MYYPTLEQFKELANDHNLIPVCRDIVADIDTPVSAFLKLGRSENAFLLESVEGAERMGRYSFLGSRPYCVVTCKNGEVEVREGTRVTKRRVADPLDVIQEILAERRAAQLPELPPFFGGAVGYLSFDGVRYFEDIPARAEDDLGLPDMVFLFTDTILIFDHVKHKIKVVANAAVNGLAAKSGGGGGEAKSGAPSAPGQTIESAYREAQFKIDSIIDALRKPVTTRPLEESAAHMPVATGDLDANMPKERFLDMVRRAKEHIVAGDVFQVVLSQRFQAPLAGDTFDIYRVLRSVNPSPYMYYLRFEGLELIGSSPEPLVRVEDGTVVTRPIAGTRPRGATAEEDMSLQQELLADAKERAEHIMLVDLGRNDIGRVCTPGTVKVDDLMFIEKYSHVMHIVSNVSGELAAGRTAFDVLRAAFPAGTVSGAPKIRAMEIIDELEPTRRGPYAGAVGYFSYGGNLDTCITIRTVVVADGRAYVQAGAGIVADSDPESEYQETVNKAHALLAAVEMAGRGKVAVG